MICPQCKQNELKFIDSDPGDFESAPIAEHWYCYNCGCQFPHSEIMACIDCGKEIISRGYYCDQCLDFHLERGDFEPMDGPYKGIDY